MTHKIALVFGVEDYNDDTIVAHSITDWVEVSEDEFNLLRNNGHDYEVRKRLGCDNHRSICVIEQPVSQANTIAEALAVVKAVQAERLAEQKKRADAYAKQQADAAAKRALKKAEKEKKSEAELLAALAEKHPDLVRALATKAGSADEA